MCDNASAAEDDLKTMMVKFTISNLYDKPDDVVSYALNYFQELKDLRERYKICTETETMNSEVVEQTQESFIEEHDLQLEFRRNCIYGVEYNPQEDFIIDQVLFPKTEEEHEKISRTIFHTFPFYLFNRKQIKTVIDSLRPVKVKSGDHLILQSTDAQNFYVIKTGVFQVLMTHPKQTFVLDDSGCFGERSLAHITNYDYTVKAMTNGIVWEIDRFSFRKIITKATFAQRKFDEQLISCMQYFKDLSTTSRMSLVDNVKHKFYQPGETIVKYGEPSDAIYFIVDGVVKITVINDCGLEVTVNQLGKADYFGETAFLWKKPRFFSAYAEDDTEVELVFLEVEVFERILGNIQEVLGKVLRTNLMIGKSSTRIDEDSIC